MDIHQTKNLNYLLSYDIMYVGHLSNPYQVSWNDTKLIISIRINENLKSKLPLPYNLLIWIAGQTPHVIKNKKAVAAFKIRKKSLGGLKVTLRRKKLENFLTLLHLGILPKVRDFKGFKINNTSAFSIGIKDLLLFPHKESMYNELYDLKGGLDLHFHNKISNTLYFLLKSKRFPLFFINK